jgi:hypothetical protein
MEWLYAFSSELKIVFDEVKSRIQRYPVEFQHDANYFLEMYDVTKPGFCMECMSFMIPFWLMEPLKLGTDSATKISTANLMGLFYFLLQDEIIDVEINKSNHRMLPLANLFYLDFMELYRSLFPYGSQFWKYVWKFIMQWTRSMAFERRERCGSKSLRGGYNLKALAHKSAPQKVAVAAACILTGNVRCISKLSDAVDYTTASLQLMDDWQDWKDDLKNNHCTYFLSQVMKSNNITKLSDVDEFDFTQAVYCYGIFDRLASIVDENHEFIKRQQPRVPYLVEYHLSILDKFKEKQAAVNNSKDALLFGGFSNWLNSQVGRDISNKIY